jgi:hypothetical protein
MYEHCYDPENATPDSQLYSVKHGKIVNESSLFAGDLLDYNLDNADFEESEDQYAKGITLTKAAR